MSRCVSLSRDVAREKEERVRSRAVRKGHFHSKAPPQRPEECGSDRRSVVPLDKRPGSGLSGRLIKQPDCRLEQGSLVVLSLPS